MNAIAALVLAATVAVAAAQLPAPADQSAQIGKMQWLSGCWIRRSGQTITEEQWMSPRGASMLGMSRTVRNDATIEYEHIRLFEREGKLVYHATPSGQQPTEFTSVKLAEGSATFENLAHDFPQRVIYTRVGADSLIARIEGTGPNGTRGVDFRFARAACGAVTP